MSRRQSFNYLCLTKHVPHADGNDAVAASLHHDTASSKQQFDVELLMLDLELFDK